MNKYIAALDFGTQNIRVLVDYGGDVVFEENYFYPVVHQSVSKIDGQFRYSKGGIKRIIAESTVQKELEKLPKLYYQDFFNRLYTTITQKLNGPLSGTIVLVPELYSEIQRFTLKEILEKAGFGAINLLNFSKVCAESLNLSNQSVSEVISIGADYFSLSLIKHETGRTKPFDLETKSGMGGFHMDEIFFDQLAADMGINNTGHDKQVTDVLLSLIKKLESLKHSSFIGSQPVIVDYSSYNPLLKEISLDKEYLANCFGKYCNEISGIQQNLLSNNKDTVIDQVIVAGDIPRLDIITRALNIEKQNVIYIQNRNLLITAISIAREDLLSIIENNPEEKKIHVKQEIAEKSSKVNTDNSNTLSHLLEKYMIIEKSIADKTNFEDAELLIQDIKQHLHKTEARLFYEAAHSCYLKDDFQNAYKQVKNAIKAEVNPLTKRLFENIVFKQVAKLQNLHMQREVVLLLREAKELNISDTIKEAFVKENQLNIAQNSLASRGSNFTPKKKKRH